MRDLPPGDFPRGQTPAPSHRPPASNGHGSVRYVRTPRVFYGWWIVGASVLISMYTAGAVFYGFTAIFEPIVSEFGWSYTQISLAASLRGLEMGILAPVVGVLVDRLGPRRLMLAGCVVAAAGLLLLSRTNSLATFYWSFILISAGLSTCTMTVITASVANWFRRRIGLATGIAISGFGLGGLMIPVVVHLVDAYDWRTTVALLAAGMIIVVAPLSLLFRHRPAQYGYLPDGASPPETQLTPGGTPPSSTDDEPQVSVRQALKSRAFWALALSFTSHMLVVTAIITHVMPYLSSIGVARPTASLVATAIPLSSIAGRLAFGWISDRFNRWRTAATGFGLLAVGLVCFAAAASVGLWVLVPFLIFFSTGYGGLNVMRASLLRDIFGRKTFGTLFGILMGVNMAGSIAGPVLAGWAFDSWGSYRDIWLIFAVVPLVPLAISLTLSKGPSATISPEEQNGPG